MNFQENQKFSSRWVGALFTIALLLTSASIYFSYNKNTAVFVFLLPFILLGFVFVFIYKFNNFTIEITDSGVFLQIPLFKKEFIGWNEIKSINPQKISPIKDFGGWGLRYNLKGTTGYVFSGTNAIFIERNNGKKVAFTITDSETFMTIANEKLPN
jgi:hypothetical protein